MSEPYREQQKPMRIRDSQLARNVQRALRFNFRRILEPPVIKLGDALIGVDYVNWSPLMLRQFLRGDYEERERQTVSAALAHDDVVLDIGGGVGVIALCARKNVPDRNIYVYEANPDLVEQITANFVRNNANIHIHHAAVVPQHWGQTVIEFNIAKDFWSSSLLPFSSEVRSVEVPAVRINEAINRHSPTVIIMDIEGAECAVLENCELNGVRKLIIEFHQRNTGRSRANALINSLLNRGFEIDLEKSERDVLLFERPTPDALESDNDTDAAATT